MKEFTEEEKMQCIDNLVEFIGKNKNYPICTAFNDLTDIEKSMKDVFPELYDFVVEVGYSFTKEFAPIVHEWGEGTDREDEVDSEYRINKLLEFKKQLNFAEYDKSR